MRDALLIAVVVAGGVASVSAQTPSGWRAHDLTRPRPAVVTPGQAAEPVPPPSDAVVLFDGTGPRGVAQRKGAAAGWVVRDGAMEAVAGAGYVYTRQAFGDVQLHIEWAAPAPPKDSGQGRGNSGVFLMGEYELQVLDSYHNDTYPDGQAGAAYGQYPPLVNAALPPGAWQSYDIVFRRPRFDAAGVLLTPARMTAFQNGILIQDARRAVGPDRVAAGRSGMWRTPVADRSHYRTTGTRFATGTSGCASCRRGRRPPRHHRRSLSRCPHRCSMRWLAGTRMTRDRCSRSTGRVLASSLTLPGSRKQALIPISNREFALGGTAATLTVTPGPGGRPAKLTFRMGDTVFDLKPLPPPVH